MSYLTDHPTNFIWVPRVRRRVKAVEAAHPWQTYINTYWDHPPDFQDPRRWPPGYYDEVSFDVWAGGFTDPKHPAKSYNGYRGKPLPKALGDEIFNELFNTSSGPFIDWIIWNGNMWWAPTTGGPGWMLAPPGPADSDPGHYSHLHITYQ